MVPEAPEGYTSCRAQYSVLANSTDDRARLMAALKDASIPSAIYYPIPLYLQKACENLGYKPGDFPITEDFSTRVFALPMHPYLKEEEIEQTCGVIVGA